MSQLEWMNDKIEKTFETTRENKFDFRSVRLVHSVEELAKVPKPMVVLASMASLEYGGAKVCAILGVSLKN